MNSAQFHLELLDAGTRLFEALAQERELRTQNHTSCTKDRWRHRLNAARRVVECCAERYARALKTYRRSTLSEVESPESGDPAMAERVSKHRERTRILRTPIGNRRSLAARRKLPAPFRG